MRSGKKNKKDVKIDSPKVLGLDVSTKTIGFALFDIGTKNLLELTHVSPRPIKKTESKIEELLLKSQVFRKKLEQYVGLGIEKVIIEEPLLNSNNIYTVGTLMRYNTLICREIYDILNNCDKKMIIWELVAKREPQITWQYTRNNTLSKENFDQTDAYCAALGYMKSKEIW